MSAEPPLILHASAVAVQGHGLLILGASGSGKSGLALQLMAFGAALVADDRTAVTRHGTALRLSAPDGIRGLIEARGLGLLRAPCVQAELAAMVDLDTEETDRLPPFRHKTLLGHDVPLLHKSASPHFPAALLQYLKAGREE